MNMTYVKTSATNETPLQGYVTKTITPLKDYLAG